MDKMESYRLLVLGDGSDKTCEVQVVIDDRPCVIEILDIAGREEYTSYDQMIRDGDGFLIVYSITSSYSTFDRVEQFRNQIDRVKDTDFVPIILVGNRCNGVTERVISREEGMNKARLLKCEFIESSTETGVNVERAFYTVVRMIRANRNERRNEKEQNNKKHMPNFNPVNILQKKRKFFFNLLE